MHRTTINVVSQAGFFWLRVDTSAGIVMGSMSPSMTVRDAIAERRRVAAFYASRQLT